MLDFALIARSAGGVSIRARRAPTSHSTVTLRPSDGRGHRRARDGAEAGLEPGGEFAGGLFRRPGVADDPTFADRLAAELELGLEQRDEIRAVRRR